MSTINTFPVRYFSIVTVPKEFTHQMGQIENTALSGGASLNHDEIVKAISTGKSQLSSLTPYLFVLFEIENGGAYWTYLDLAGELSKIHFISREPGEIQAEKVSFANGGYMYVMKHVFLPR